MNEETLKHITTLQEFQFLFNQIRELRCSLFALTCFIATKQDDPERALDQIREMEEIASAFDPLEETLQQIGAMLEAIKAGKNRIGEDA